MKKSGLITAWMVFTAILLTAAPSAEITVKQEKNGRIVVSNVDHKNHTFSNKSRKIRHVKNSGSISVPKHYLTKIKKLTQKYKVNLSLVLAVAKAESSFNPFAVSHKGAVGIMQLMPDTAKQYGVYNRYNVDQNLEAGIRHLKYLYGKYNRSIPLTLAAYNAGEEAVKKYKGVPPYKETRTYIKRVMKYMGLSYNSYSAARVKQKIYKIVTNDGRVLITDRLPAKINGHVSVIE